MNEPQLQRIHMPKFALPLLIILSLSILTGCVSREQADAKLATACVAAVEALADRKLGDIADTKATPSPEGPDFRHITVMTGSDDGWLDEFGEYKCIFQETFSIFNRAHTASIYQVHYDGEIVGKAGSKILGSPSQLLQLEEAVRGALYE